MNLEKIKTVVSIIAFVIVIIVGLFFGRGHKEAFADLLAESYKCIVVEKPLEKNINSRSFIYPCIEYNGNGREINISSNLFHKIILVGDTIEKNKGDTIVIIKKRHNVLKFALSLSHISTIDTLVNR